MIIRVHSVTQDQNGQSLIEYGLIISLITLTSLVVMQLLGIEVEKLFNFIEEITSEVM